MPQYEEQPEQLIIRLHEECNRYLRKLVEAQTEVRKLERTLKAVQDERDSLLRRFTKHTTPIEAT